MTSLSNQLQSLRTATAQHQTVERRHVSLLFAKKEAEALDRETVYNIGCEGLRKLKQLDLELAANDDLFDESRLHFQRSMITNEENSALNEKIETLLFQLSPYAQHFSCQQVLEWLVFKYQIYAYNAESMILTFIPFHETNFYGRMLSILEFNFASSKDWAFLEGFAKKEFPVPFSSVVKNTVSSNHSLITRISEHLNRGIQLVGEDVLEKKCHMLFTFYTKLLIAVLEESAKIDDALLAKIIPLIAVGLKSALPSFRQASLMVICQLAIAVKLTPDVVTSLAKVVLMVSMHLKNEFSYPHIAVLKTLRSDDSIWTVLKSFREKTDLTPILKPLWTTLFSIASEDSYQAVHKQCLHALQVTSEPENIHESQAAIFLSKLLQYPELRVLYENEMFCKHVYSMVSTFSDQWEKICMEWTSRDESVLACIVQHYHLEPLMMVHAGAEAKKKRTRRRSGSIRKSHCDPSTSSKHDRESAFQRAEKMASSSEFSRRLEFSGDPMKKAREWMSKEKWDKVAWAFDEMSSRKSYFVDKLDEDIEAFILDVIHVAVTNSKCPVIDKAHSAFAEANLREKFVVRLLSRYEPNGPPPKQSRTAKIEGSLAEVFIDETKEEYEKRLKFVIDMLSSRATPVVDAEIFHVLFTLIKESYDAGNLFTMRLIGLLLKMVTSPGKYRISPADLKMDFVVNMMRTTHSHHVLRESLRLLTAAVRLSPSIVTSHVMSVFTFMGSGLFRRDNELTLGIIEDTVEALFCAICAEDGKTLPPEMRLRLVNVARILAASTCDIPAHRRSRMAHAIARAVKHANVWIVAGVLLEHFCARWQRPAADASKRSAEQDAFDDFTLELCAGLHPVYQFSAVIDILNFIVRLGGDRPTHSQEGALDQAVFDRTKYSLPKLRHFRFMMIGLVVRALSNRKFFEKIMWRLVIDRHKNEETCIKLGEMEDEVLCHSVLPIGRRLMVTLVELDEFIASERTLAEESEEQQTVRYWIALSGRAETVSEKLRHLLPGGVAATVITDILEDGKADWRMREKALQLANSKLSHDGYFFTEAGISVQHLERMASVLNNWITKERRSHEQDVLCQNAAFSLKLVAKRLRDRSNTTVLSDTMSKCIDIASGYQNLDECLVGNILLLAGELIRSMDMKTTMASALPLLRTCLDVLAYCNSSSGKDTQQQQAQQEDVPSKRALSRLQSLSGGRAGRSSLMVPFNIFQFHIRVTLLQPISERLIWCSLRAWVIVCRTFSLRHIPHSSHSGLALSSVGKWTVLFCA
ncbi:hypothetical protein GCK32_001315 [Trichostrongylus colubriformis]|uniref:HEAT repeat-containing protein 1 n=1 Tax=Trichostrongylus colubriformis TaxID=6319 RepID=A0AAN8EV84_TRICO